jgi:phosphoribosylamine-glycine ligase
LCRANGIPTAAYEHFRAPEAEKTYVHSLGTPIVIKAMALRPQGRDHRTKHDRSELRDR